MKKISQINWKRYKDSANGKDAIALFEKAQTNEFSHEEMLALAKRFDPEFFNNCGPKEEEYMLKLFDYFDSVVGDMLNEFGDVSEQGKSIMFFQTLMTAMLADNDDQKWDDLPQSGFKNILSDNILLSTVLFAYIPEFYIPNYFVMQFAYLERIAEKYDIELPKVPSRADYKSRNLYYIELCKIFNAFAELNNLDTPAEKCAFLFDYELPVAKEELENEKNRELPEKPGYAWLLVGNYGDGEKDMKHGFWQANEMTNKGDIMLFYEKSPVKALNAIYIAQADGVVDPFFHYYSNTYIGNKISIPSEQAITIDDFRNSEYFQKRDKKGNFVSKNFQDTSGWKVTFNDYKEIKRMLKEKGYDVSKLPCLYEPKKIGNITISVEKDVSEKLLIPLLEQMGWKKGIDFEGELEFNAGRGKTGFSSDKRPDFCLHFTEKNDEIEAKVVIEVKKFMNGKDGIQANFIQGHSYAKWGNAQVLVLCDMEKILVYERGKDNKFNEKKFIQYSWIDMENPDKYHELKQLLSK